MVLVLFGDGVVAQVVLSEGTKGDYQSISWGWGIGVMLGVYCGGKSGAHMNPAVTLANCVFRGHPWRKLPVYAAAQLAGAMMGAAIVYSNYRSAIDHFEGAVGRRTVSGPRATAGVFCTYPAAFMTRTGMFFSEFLASAILQFVIFALADPANMGAGPLMPLCLFFLIFGIGACFGWETGYAINLARDFGPRPVSYMVGYGSEVWSSGGYYFWIPMVAPLFGTLSGGALYDLFIYTGESPINSSWLGFNRLFVPRSSSRSWAKTQLAALGSRADYDLLVIGGGATGCGIALDAVTRGLSVALVERHDFSAGTSSKSTKLVHGGVRYLEKAVWNLDYPQLQLVIEALRERRGFLDIAPHLSASLPILLPLQRWWQAPYLWAGCKMYDLLAGAEGLQSSYFVSRARALEAFPLLRRDALVGALVYYDGQHNDSRMNVALAMTAALYGATVVNHVEVTSLEKDADGRICGAVVRDLMPPHAHDHGDDPPGARDFVVRARGVINATGPFTDAVERMDDPRRRPIVAPSSGTHVTLPGALCSKNMGILDAATSDGRVVFVLPWQGMTVAGTTDNACEVEREPVARRDDVDFILREVNKLLAPDSALTRGDVLAAWSGIRPLVKDPKAVGNTESLVRSHLVTVSPSGLLTCAGGKWTTYRQMAEDAVDEAVRAFDLRPAPVVLPDVSGLGLPTWTADGTCQTRRVPVVGVHGYSTALPAQLMERYAVDADVAHHLASNYGDRAWAVLADAAATARLAPSFPFIEAEVRYAIRCEAACTAADVISRRLRLAFLDVDQALRALPRIIDLMADELRWSEARKALEWTTTVRFLRSMGLDEDRLLATWEQVLTSSDAAARRLPRDASAAAAKAELEAGNSRALTSDA